MEELLEVGSLVDEQIIGKVFSKEEADKLFGKVLKSVELETSVIESLLDKSTSILMFNIMDDKPVVMGKYRIPLYPADAEVEEETVFHVYSIPVIKELLEKGNGPIAKLEFREEVFSITIGDFTMEFGGDCPPFC